MLLFVFGCKGKKKNLIRQIFFRFQENILKYAENDDCDCIEYAVDMSNLAMVFDRLQLFPQAEKYY